MIATMRSLAAQYPHYCYRRIRIFLQRQRLQIGRRRTYRLWRQAGPVLPKRRPCRHIATGRPWSLLPPAHTNFIWAYDFVFDATAGGRRIKCLTVVGEFIRECLAINVAGAIRSKRVIGVLSKLVSVRSAPLFLRSDNGSEFVSRAILQWSAESGVGTAHIDPNRPWQNGTDESFNGKFRDECLSIEWFCSCEEARVVIETCPSHYNTVRPHRGLRYLPPMEYTRQLPSLQTQPAVLQNWVDRKTQSKSNLPLLCFCKAG